MKATLKEAFEEIKEKGFEEFCKTLYVGSNCCPIWLEIVDQSCRKCENNRKQVYQKIVEKFRKEKLKKLLS